jgi:sulfur carrier protein ThiS
LKIQVEYAGFLKVREIGQNPVIEMPEGSTVYDLYRRLGLQEEDTRYMQAFIINDAAWKSTKLKDNDRVTIISIVAGG